MSCRKSIELVNKINNSDGGCPFFALIPVTHALLVQRVAQAVVRVFLCYFFCSGCDLSFCRGCNKIGRRVRLRLDCWVTRSCLIWVPLHRLYIRVKFKNTKNLFRCFTTLPRTLSYSYRRHGPATWSVAQPAPSAQPARAGTGPGSQFSFSIRRSTSTLDVAIVGLHPVPHETLKMVQQKCVCFQDAVQHRDEQPGLHQE